MSVFKSPRLCCWLAVWCQTRCFPLGRLPSCVEWQQRTLHILNILWVVTMTTSLPYDPPIPHALWPSGCLHGLPSFPRMMLLDLGFMKNPCYDAFFFNFLALARSWVILLQIEAFSKPSFQATPKGTRGEEKPPSALAVHLSSPVGAVTNH